MYKLKEAIINAEQILGVHITGDVAAEVLMYAIRKCKCIGKDSSYLPLLFESELLDFYMRAEINARAVARTLGGVV